MEGKVLLFGIVTALVVLLLLSARFESRRSGRGPQHAGGWRMQARLGQEATDLEAFNAAMTRNAPLGETPQELQGLGRGYGTPVTPLKDDETYARRYHAAHGKTETKP